VAPTWIPPQEGNAVPVIEVPAGQLYDGSYANMRGADPTMYVHGANYGGYLATGFNSSLVYDDEAASRAEYRYQHVQEHASRTPAYGDPYSCPRPNARSTSLWTSFDGREGESQSLQVLGRIEDVMARMERHLAASTPAQVTSSATNSMPFNPGEFHSFIFTLNCWNLPMFFEILCLAFFLAKFQCLLSFGFDPSRDQAAREIGFCLHPDPVVLNRI
jgi:hypothetical protein